MNEISENQKPMVSYFWKGLALFLLGVLTGLVISPVTKGIEICCHNTDSMNANLQNDKNKENKE